MTCAWGIDAQTPRASFAAVTTCAECGGLEQTDLHAASCPGCEGFGVTQRILTTSFPAGACMGDRFHMIFSHVAQAAVRLSSFGVPELVVVEQPASFPRQPEPALYYAVGATLAGVSRGLPDGVRVLTHPPGWWKKRSVGNGNANKDAVHVWARGRGYTGSLQDESDALGIATAAWREVR